jgi:hypothetical protein
MHSFKISPTFPCSVEDCSLAEVAVVVIFVDSVAKANKVVVKDSFVSVSPLTTPAARVTISNNPPFIGDEVLIRDLSRQKENCVEVHMILNKKDAELNLVFSIKVNDFDYAVFVNSGTQSFGCGREGHLVRTCPEKTPGKRAEPAEVTAGTSTNVEAVKQRMANVENHIQSVKNVEGKKRNVEDAKQCGENPEDTILGVENERQSECIVQEEGNNAVKEPAESVEVGPITAAAEECSDSEEGLIEFYTLTACKTPLFKRKQGSETCGSA